MSPPTTKIDSWAIKLAAFINRMGALRASIVFILLTLGFTLAGSYVLRAYLSGQSEYIDFITAVILTLVSAPWVLFFFSELVKQLERSRLDLKRVIDELERLHEEDAVLNRELQNNIELLNYEIAQRKEAEKERESVFVDLEHEIKYRSENERKAQRLSALFRSIIDASPDLIYYRNEEGKFAGCNRIAEELTGKTEAELIGLTPHDVYDVELASQIVASDHEVLETNAGITEELWLKFGENGKQCYEMRKVPFFDSEGNRLGLLAFGRDISERKRSQDALAKASKDKTAFIATISHELRTPLNGIVGLSRMLRDTQLNNEQFNWVSTIYASAITLGNIFNDIIDLDKLDRERLELSLKTVSLHDFTKELGSIVELLAADKGLTLHTHVIQPLPDFVEVDGTRLRQVLWNLLFNAVKFTQQGSVSFSVEASMPENGKCCVKFKVTDTGVGIPNDELDKIFAMYYQVKNPNHYSATGTGIGLAICEQMVTRMNGHISVSSVVGEGTSFTVELPLALSKTPMQVEELQVTGLNILLVEDIELNVMVAKALLEKLEQKVDVAMTGEDAIQQVRNHKYDLILLDIQLPDMTGFDIAKALADENLVGDTKIVALTANVIKTREDYLNNGMQDVISKPVKKSRVIEVFNKLFVHDKALPKVSEPGEQKKQKKEEEKLAAILDIELLEMFLETIGADMLRNSAKVLQEKMPEYIDDLLVNLTAKDQDEVCSQAHKIKGAAGSVGLVRVGKIANQIQQGDYPAWWQNVDNWVEELQQAYQQDMRKLEEWLSENDIDA
ncbi:aerobic respiration two-component sensor histidine kinase ArcB [Alteromonadaceae bacterium M269]|nr:aerobic respiration two-component sensor histidine kinase ArcB [Alteromonadaceae bacterium M269]